MTPLKLKLSHDGVMRRAAAPDPLTFAAAADLAARLFHIPPPTALTYLDDENDTITVSSDVELQEAAGIPRNTAALKLDVVAVSPLDDWAADWSVAAPADTGADTGAAAAAATPALDAALTLDTLRVKLNHCGLTLLKPIGDKQLHITRRGPALIWGGRLHVISIPSWIRSTPT